MIIFWSSPCFCKALQFDSRNLIILTKIRESFAKIQWSSPSLRMNSTNGKTQVSKTDGRKVDRMLKAIKNEEDKIVYIKSGVNVSYGEVVNVINEVRKLGVDKIGLVADKKKGGPPPPPKA